MNKNLLLSLLVFCFSPLYSQNNAALDSAILNLTKQLLVFPHEKIHLHTDKPYYITGETIFFRAYLLDALTNKQIALSRYIYVELIDPADSVVNRVKIRPDENLSFYGVIPVSEELTQGDYKIRAYTQYMRNQGEKSFFSKYVKIRDPQILSMQIESDFNFESDGKVNTGIRFVDSKTKEIIKPQSVKMRLNKERFFSSKPDNEGWIRIKLNVASNSKARTLYVEMIENKRIYRQYLQIPYPEGDFDVSFYPEGGHLITGQTSVVAFKAVDTNGSGLIINGEILDSKGNKVNEFKTFHDGMGEFLINPMPDETYHAVCHHGNLTLRFDLPEARINTFVLKTEIKESKLRIAVNKYALIPYPKLYLMVNSGGLVIYANTWDSSKDFITINKLDLPSGISHILLLTEDLQIISERLVFILNNDNGIAEFQTQKDSYLSREQILAEIRLIDENRQPLKGSFSISVTNDREVIPDTTSGIKSGILLNSELKGIIYNPEYYLQKGNKDTEISADLLMKTHGWRRYSIPDILKGELSYPAIPFETSQEFSGTVKSGLFSRLAKEFQISLISLNAGFYDMTETDEEGRFVFKNFEFPDSTNYVIQALNQKGKGKEVTELLVDTVIFPDIYSGFTKPVAPEGKEKNQIFDRGEENQVLLDYVAKADLHYTYVNGMRTINLPEVEIKASKPELKYKDNRYFPDYTLTEEDLQENSSIISAVSRFPLVWISQTAYGYEITFITRGRRETPLVLLDGFPRSTEEIFQEVGIEDIGQIDVIKSISNLTAFGPGGNGGVIAFYTKRGENRPPRSYPNIKKLIPLGYQIPVEFYSPKYDTQESKENQIPDLRTTIYWNPSVLTDDEGYAKLDFYTADDAATYSVEVEGVSEEGVLINYRSKSGIKVN